GRFGTLGPTTSGPLLAVGGSRRGIGGSGGTRPGGSSGFDRGNTRGNIGETKDLDQEDRALNHLL
ncbi:hypothetical protein KI387_030722, partial [Taxus chinensis]